MSFGSTSAQEQSVVPPLDESHLDSESSDKLDVSDDSWPSISSVSSGDALEISFDAKPSFASGESTSEMEWPSIASQQQNVQPLDQAPESEDDASMWPSIAFDDQQDLALTQEQNTKEAGSIDPSHQIFRMNLCFIR